jgi:phage shock protein E
MKNFAFLLGVLLVVAAAGCARKPADQAGAPPDAAGAAASGNVSCDDADRLLRENKDIIVLDVRRPDEFAEGHIPGATNLDFYAPDFQAKLAGLDKDKTYLIHCQAGGRSGKTEKLMQQLNFKSVLHLNEGFGKWEEAGKPVEK